jgi:prepilin-type N-terminal cleavage/methylation domain-containing protein
MTQNSFVANSKGFTIIEMLVSLALFTIVATVATGALLTLIGNNSRVVEEQSVMTTLSFALDSMAREIRTGYSYYCGTKAAVTGSLSDTAEKDCLSGGEGLSFLETGGSITNSTNNSDPKRLAYYLEGNQIKRKVESVSSAADMTSTNDVLIEDLFFYVSDPTPLTENNTIDENDNIGQPTVTIIIKAKAANSESDKEYTVQTTVTQRSLDI